MYLNTVFKYNVFKYCQALSIVEICLVSALEIGTWDGESELEIFKLSLKLVNLS